MVKLWAGRASRKKWIRRADDFNSSISFDQPNVLRRISPGCIAHATMLARHREFMDTG